jgi:hypothetical protein
LIIAVGLMAALTVNFVFGFKHLAEKHREPDVTVAGLNETFYARHPMQLAVHEFVYRVLGH